MIEAEIVSPRTPDPIMGWSSANDTFTELKGCLRFPTQDDALAFARNKGWEVIVEEPTQRKIRPRNYLDNFRITTPQDEERAAR